ncbi:MAG: amino acid adenylation domain-containing protein [Lachnospiraceae bacterium]|nr:amino acid adenylation domain-containing protein [Lachnospiraceae bacterium]
MNKNVLEWLEEAADKNPDRIVYEDSEESMTFGELFDEARRIGSALIRENLSDKPVAVMMGRGVHTIAAYLGIVYSGHAYAPIDRSQPDFRIQKILELLKPEAVLCDAEIKDNIGAAKLLFSDRLRDSGILEDELMAVRREATELSPLYIIFTSGSSGRPKGVMTSHHALMNYISAYADMMDIGPEDRLCSQSPLDYIAAIRDIYVPLLKGCYSFLCPKEYFMQPGLLFDKMNEKGITCVGWSVSALSVLVRLKAFREKKPEYLKKVCFSGSVMPAGVLAEWQEALPEALFVNQYGPTEVTASCTYYRIDHRVADNESIPAGVPYDNYRVFLLSEDDGPVERGGTGEICVAGPGLALGYYNDPERTKASFVQNPLNKAYNETIYKTGDLGRFREDGLLEFHGRYDRQIKHMGHRVELDEIELAAMASEGVGEAAAVYDAENENIWLFYSGGAELKSVIVGMRGRLPGFMVPRKVKRLDELPKLANSKTDMEKLKELLKE